jgi:hypothetical protein
MESNKQSGICRRRNRFASGTGGCSLPVRIQASQFVITALNRCSALGTFFPPATKDNPSYDQQRNNNLDYQMPTVKDYQTFPFCTIILRATCRNARWKRSSGVGQKFNEIADVMLEENAVNTGGIVDLANHSGVTACLN